MTYFSPIHFLGLTVVSAGANMGGGDGTSAGPQQAGQGSRERPASAGSTGAATPTQSLNLPLRFVPLVAFAEGGQPVHPGMAMSKEASRVKPLVHWPADESYGFSFAANPPLFTLSRYTTRLTHIRRPGAC